MRRFLPVLVAVALVVALGGPAFGDNSRPASSPDHRITAMDHHSRWHHGDDRDHGYYRHRSYDDRYYRYRYYGYPYYYYRYPYYYDGYYGDYYGRCRWGYYHGPYRCDRYCRGYSY